jgi:hypothetical protein
VNEGPYSSNYSSTDGTYRIDFEEENFVRSLFNLVLEDVESEGYCRVERGAGMGAGNEYQTTERGGNTEAFHPFVSVKVSGFRVHHDKVSIHKDEGAHEFNHNRLTRGSSQRL